MDMSAKNASFLLTAPFSLCIEPGLIDNAQWVQGHADKWSHPKKNYIANPNPLKKM